MKYKKDNKRATVQALALVSQLGLVMITAIGIAAAAGIWLDRTLGTSFFTILFFFLGAAGGISAAYSLVKQFDAPGEKKEENITDKKTKIDDRISEEKR